MYSSCQNLSHKGPLLLLLAIFAIGLNGQRHRSSQSRSSPSVRSAPAGGCVALAAWGAWQTALPTTPSHRRYQRLRSHGRRPAASGIPNPAKSMAKIIGTTHPLLIAVPTIACPFQECLNTSGITTRCLGDAVEDTRHSFPALNGCSMARFGHPTTVRSTYCPL